MVRTLFVIAAAVMLLGGIVLTARSGDGHAESAKIALGQIYASDAGDPVDVVAAPGEVAGTICANVGGFFYGSGISCFVADGAEVTGSWMVVIPEHQRKPPIVVGVLPAAARAATVVVRGERTAATPRG